MAIIQRAMMVLTLLGTPWIGGTAYADEHHHEAPSERQQIPPAAPAKKWETDDVVRQRMETIRRAVASSESNIQQSRLTAQDYRQIADVISTNVGQIIKDCKLTQATDAALHTLVLTDLTHSSEIMRTSTRLSAQRAGALGVLQSLRLYGQYFEHPGWVMAPAK